MRKSSPLKWWCITQNRGRLGRVGQACRNCPRQLWDQKIERLNCPTWQKLELYQAVIDTTKGTYKPKEHQKPGWQPSR